MLISTDTPMLSEHNPIAELIHQIQKKWTDEVSPHPELKLVRWLIKPEWARLFEGFLKLESTEHGSLPEVVVAMLTPFESGDTYAQQLGKDWVAGYESDKKTTERLANRKPVREWNPKFFLHPSVAADDNERFFKLLSSFEEEMVEENRRLVVAFYPRAVHHMEGFTRWLAATLKIEFSNRVTFMVFDHIGEFYFDKIFEKNPGITKTLHLNLDLDGAVRQIAKMGNPALPEVKFRECILEMGDAVQKNNPKRLHQWGEKALVVTQQSGLKSLYASAHIVYAGMLFTLKQYQKIDDLLSNGLNVAKQGLKTGDAACKPLLIQFYGYMAASKQLQKKATEAVEAYEKGGDAAIEFGLPGMALMPYQQAYTLGRKALPHRYEQLLKKAYATGRTLSPEEQGSGAFAAVAADYLQWQKTKQLWDEAAQTDEEIKTLLGDDWQERAKTSAHYTIKDAEPAPVN